MTLELPPSVHMLVAHASGLAPQQVQGTDRLVEDLEMDSLEVAGLFLDIENTHGVILPRDVVQSIHTVADLDAAVTARGNRHA
ncbi:acyl carrier protein [Stenotrophomonas sp. NPDC077659]|uniref:acyl carrier protein n=1 Tax=Stenotrophomonas sp. NPDC077659 TaxID=3390694 RepID=UPI003CFDF9CF